MSPAQHRLQTYCVKQGESALAIPPTATAGLVADRDQGGASCARDYSTSATDADIASAIQGRRHERTPNIRSRAAGRVGWSTSQ